MYTSTKLINKLLVIVTSTKYCVGQMFVGQMVLDQKTRNQQKYKKGGFLKDLRRGYDKVKEGCDLDK